MKRILRILAILMAVMLLSTILTVSTFAEDGETENNVVAHWKFQDEEGYYTGNVEDEDLTFIDLTGNGNDLEVCSEGNGNDLDIFEWDEGVLLSENSAYQASSSLRFGNTWEKAQSVDPYDPSLTEYTGAYVSGKYFQTVDTAPLNSIDSSKGWAVEIIFKIDAEWNNNYNRYAGIFSRQGVVESQDEPSFSMALTEQITGSSDGYIGTDGTTGLQYVHVDVNEDKTNFELMNGEIYGERWIHYMVTSDGTYTEAYINGELVFAASENNELYSTDDFFGWEVGVGRKLGTDKATMNPKHAEGMIRRLFCGSIAEIRFTQNYLNIENSLYYTNEIGAGAQPGEKGDPLLVQNNVYNYWTEELVEGCFTGLNQTDVAYTEEGVKLIGIANETVDPYATINLRKYVSEVNAEPLSCADYLYVVLKVKTEGTTGGIQFYYTSRPTAEDVEESYCEPNGEWQYMIIDLNYCDAWESEGSPITVRLDWATGYEGNAEDAYMILNEIAFFKTEEEAYAHAGMEMPTKPPKTEAPETEAPETSTPEAESEIETNDSEKSGCSGAFAAGASCLITTAAAFVFLIKRKRSA